MRVCLKIGCLILVMRRILLVSDGQSRRIYPHSPFSPHRCVFQDVIEDVENF